jgi:hypothetical protein
MLMQVVLKRDVDYIIVYSNVNSFFLKRILQSKETEIFSTTKSQETHLGKGFKKIKKITLS